MGARLISITQRRSIGVPLIAATVVVVLGAAAAIWWPGSDDAPPVTTAATPSSASGWSTPTYAGGAAAAPGLATVPPAAAPALPPGVTLLTVDGAEENRKAFRADAKGRLILDEKARLGVEKLVGLNSHETLAGAVAEQTLGLTPEAAAQARDLVERYGHYEAARRETHRPGNAPLVPEEGLSELAATRALRASYFGAETAQRLFGEEEKVTQRLLELMRDDRDGTLTMEQKAQRAQARYTAEAAAAQPR